MERERLTRHVGPDPDVDAAVDTGTGIDTDIGRRRYAMHRGRCRHTHGYSQIYTRRERKKRGIASVNTVTYTQQKKSSRKKERRSCFCQNCQ